MATTSRCGTSGSRAVVVQRAGAGFEAAPLSRDHNPDLPDERRRVEAAGGFVSDPPAPGLSARVWLDAKRTRVGLAMSRSLGDGAAKRVGVVSDAEVRRHAVDVARDAALVAASCVEINQCVGCTRQFFTKSFLGDDAAVLARSSGEEPASRRWRGRAVKF